MSVQPQKQMYCCKYSEIEVEQKSLSPQSHPIYITQLVDGDTDDAEVRTMTHIQQQRNCIQFKLNRRGGHEKIIDATNIKPSPYSDLTVTSKAQVSDTETVECDIVGIVSKSEIHNNSVFDFKQQIKDLQQKYNQDTAMYEAANYALRYRKRLHFNIVRNKLFRQHNAPDGWLRHGIKKRTVVELFDRIYNELPDLEELLLFGESDANQFEFSYNLQGNKCTTVLDMSDKIATD